MKYRLTLLLTILCILPNAALAAQDALITRDQAAIRERPSNDAKIIESKPSGAKLRVSNYSKDGWYKTKASTGQFGWIWQADISFDTVSSDIKAAKLELAQKPHEKRLARSEPFLFLKAGGILFPMLSGDVAEQLGNSSSKLFFTLGGFLDLSVTVDEGMRAALRLATYSHTSSHVSRGVSYDVTLSSTPIMLGIEKDISDGEVIALAIGLYGGVGYNNKLQIIAPSFSKPNSFTYQKTYFAILASLSGKYWVNSWFAAVGELGLFYTQLPQVDVTGFNGDTAFRNSTTGRSVSLNVTQAGPMLSLGAQFAF